MCKIISFLFLAVLVFTAKGFSQSNNNSVLLYSQTGLTSKQWSISSSFINENLWQQVADDFAAASDWAIDKIVVVGMDVDTSYSGFNIYIYTNDNGSPVTLVYYAEAQPYTISFITYFIWYVTITLETPANINAGDYFISVQSKGNWFAWTQVSGMFGNLAMYREQSYLSWVPVSPTPYTDMYFELYGSQVVPVELTSFSATVNDEIVELNWITSTETNNQGFDIERSQMSEVKSQMEWEKIGFVDGHGTTTQSQAYSFQDINVVAGKYNYRLKQIDFDGTFEYSNGIEVEVTSPSTFSLEQNYPNPFNPSTKIRYSVANVIASGVKQSTLVALKVYDVLGNEIATLVNEEKTAGIYEVEFNASNLPSGTYFYKLSEGELVQTKKMILLK
jgi:hypothetical protein